jgi:hypothetical protein
MRGTSVAYFTPPFKHDIKTDYRVNEETTVNRMKQGTLTYK